MSDSGAFKAVTKKGPSSIFRTIFLDPWGHKNNAERKQLRQTYAVSICAWFLKFQFGSLLQSKKKYWVQNKLEFELDLYCLCSLQKSISKSNWFFWFFKLHISKLKKKSSNTRYFKNQVEIDRGIVSLHILQESGQSLPYYNHLGCIDTV